MNLLPKSHHEFGQTEYWNAFFKKRGKKAFEWYGEYPELCDHLHKYIKNKDKILMVGCGNSKLSMDLYDVGIKQIVNIDISQVVIKQMIETNKSQRPDMVFEKMDATAMSYENNEFSVVLDKGTLDALMTDETEDVKATVQKYFLEIDRVLRNGGRYICISLLQEHILKILLEYFPKNNFMFRIVRCFEAEQKTAETTEGAVMPVFLIVATKLQKLPLKVLEVCMGGETMHRCSKEDEVVESIVSAQKAALVFSGLQKGNIANSKEIKIELCQPNSTETRYTLYIVDQPPARGNKKYAAFIIPQGREVEWLFSTPEGRKKLVGSCGCNRLAIVALHRNQMYKSLDVVKEELEETVKNLAPLDMKEKILFMSLGNEIGQRSTVYKGTSKLSGDFVVEDFEGNNGKAFRRLIFMSNPFVTQSEALLDSSGGNPDTNYLACQHHSFMSVGVNLLTQQKNQKKNYHVLVVGLGGGGLCTFLHKIFRNITITAVEIDEAMLKVAEDYFSLKQDEKLKVVVDDGIEYLRKSAANGNHFDAILFDVDSKDLSLGMSCPPKKFVEEETLKNVQKLIGSSGLFILNLVCRNEELRNQVLEDVKKIFKICDCYKLSEDLNEIVYCQNNNSFADPNKRKGDWQTACKGLNKISKKTCSDNSDIVEVVEFMDDLKINS